MLKPKSFQPNEPEIGVTYTPRAVNQNLVPPPNTHYFKVLPRYRDGFRRQQSLTIFQQN